MKNRSFPVGLVVTLTLLWIGTLATTVGGWVAMRQIFNEAPPSSNRPAVSSTQADPNVSTSSSSTPAPTDGHRLVWSPDAFWRFVVKAGSASLGAILFLLLAVGAGFLWQEKVESTNE